MSLKEIMLNYYVCTDIVAKKYVNQLYMTSQSSLFMHIIKYDLMDQ